MAFFTQDYIDFFEELTENNDREWFLANKKRFEINVKKPFEAFVGELINRVHELDSEVQIEPKQAVFRIYRDVRFSKDKTPYKLHLGAVISAGGRKNTQTTGVYVHCSAKKVVCGGGMFEPNKENLIKIRREIQANPDAFDSILNAPKFKKTYGELKGTKNKILPKEFKEDGKNIPLLFHKQFYGTAEYQSDKVLFREDLLDFIMEHYQVLEPLNNYLKEAIL